MAGTVYLRHESGAMHALQGRRLAKLLAELKAGRGGPEITTLVASGYSETMAGNCVDSLTYDSLLAESRGVFTNTEG
jgi:hypothetical protein